MRVYIPALSSDLADDRPPLAGSFAAIPTGGMGAEEIELLEDEAQTEAALACLMRLRDAGPDEALRRIVIAADAQDALVAIIDPADETSRIAEVAPGQLNWSDVVAILIDGVDAEDAVRDVLAAEDQESADAAVERLWGHGLEWFDISERTRLAGS